jgi:probable rRNA maturation factor
LSIRIYYDNIDFRLKGSRKAVKIIEKVIMKEGKISGDLNFIFTDDESLKRINKEFLKHDYFTDVITFGYNVDDKIDGEIYISIERVKENSVNYKVSLKNEVTRIMIHGVLHLLGYGDKNKADRKRMRLMEDFFLIDFNGVLNEL